jgi:hypothetical protein
LIAFSENNLFWFSGVQPKASIYSLSSSIGFQISRQCTAPIIQLVTAIQRLAPNAVSVSSQTRPTVLTPHFHSSISAISTQTFLFPAILPPPLFQIPNPKPMASPKLQPTILNNESHFWLTRNNLFPPQDPSPPSNPNPNPLYLDPLKPPYTLTLLKHPKNYQYLLPHPL